MNLRRRIERLEEEALDLALLAAMETLTDDELLAGHAHLMVELGRWEESDVDPEVLALGRVVSARVEGMVQGGTEYGRAAIGAGAIG